MNFIPWRGSRFDLAGAAWRCELQKFISYEVHTFGILPGSRLGNRGKRRRRSSFLCGCFRSDARRNTNSFLRAPNSPVATNCRARVGSRWLTIVCVAQTPDPELPEIPDRKRRTKPPRERRYEVMKFIPSGVRPRGMN